jgi:hypothetical protein
MSEAEWIGPASLIASLVAAIYALLGYHLPRAPKQPSPPRFIGELPASGPALSDFLLKNEGQVVDLDVGFAWIMDDDLEPEADFIQAAPVQGDKDAYRLVLSHGPTEEGNVTRLTKYDVIDLPGQHMSAFASDPAGGRFGILRGAFIPRGKGARKQYSYGLLIQVDELNRALLSR